MPKTLIRALLPLAFLSLASLAAELPASFVLQATDPLASEDNGYALAFSLADGGSLRLVTNADGQLKQGVELTFTRRGTKLEAVLQVGTERHDLSADFTAVAADRPLALDVDVHAHGHVIVDGAGNETLEFAFSRRVTGRHWGVGVKNGTLTKARAGRPRHEH